MNFHYVWLWWSCGFLGLWGAVLIWRKDLRAKMIRASPITMLFGLTEPLFVPKYWNPPSLFDLAQRTGFDIESLIFCFATGGLGVVLYDLVFQVQDRPIPPRARLRRNHLLHLIAVLLPIGVFAVLFFKAPWNPIYDGIAAMFLGALAVMISRPDLAKPIWAGGLLFLGMYVVFFLSLVVCFPGYVSAVWNLRQLSGVILLGIPLEEYLYAYTFGLYWSSAYEFIYWYRRVRIETHATSWLPGA